MITFGYKSRINGPLRALVAIAIGIMMVVNPGEALPTVVRIIAAFMAASGLVTAVVGLVNRKNGAMPLLTFNAVVDILLAVVLYMAADFVAGFVIVLIGIVLLIFGVIQLVALMSARRIMALGLGAFALPALVTLTGFLLVFNPFAEEVMIIVAGVSLVVYGASELFSSWKMKKAMDEYEIHQGPKPEKTEEADESLNDAKEVDYEKVDEQ